MPIALRHIGQPVAELPPLPGVVIEQEYRADVMAALQRRSVEEIEERFCQGHVAYVARKHGEPAAFGWIATRTAYIGELQSTFTIPAGERYLWNFVTLPAFRGQGIYPRLLDAMVRAEMANTDVEQFWVAYAPENHASGAGIRKAGFTDVAELSFDEQGRPATTDIVTGGAAIVAAFLGLPAATDPLAPCWRCARAAAPAKSGCYTGPCCCDYQKPADCAS